MQFWRWAVAPATAAFLALSPHAPALAGSGAPEHEATPPPCPAHDLSIELPLEVVEETYRETRNDPARGEHGHYAPMLYHSPMADPPPSFRELFGLFTPDCP
ncbi:hypothetical protein [Salinactinospora qingdaonensis]|uniref:Uncharacterized protein n=1 Tax=Salinactinospora qingdaonensis TaxID=702744 RepID=A0ABP7GIN5_9ACTN